MKFSILTPSFNSKPYIGKCIDSVAAQNIPDVEHIIFDGASTDGTVDILKANSHRLGFWASEPDKGQSDALNKALAKATGDIIGWLNADEFYEPNILGMIQKAFEKRPDAVVVYGNFNRVTETGRRIRTTRTWRFDYDVCSIQTPIIMNCAAFFRRDAILACGGFARELRYIMDWELYTRLMAGENRTKWVRINKTLANFTMHATSKTVSEHDGFGKEIGEMRARFFPNLTPEQMWELQKKQGGRMMWHMFLDGVIFEKIWFKIFRQRHYQGYYSDPGRVVPILTPFLNWIDPPKKSSDPK
jgi:glycosyltransferase involved in cell wall biosynthesis